MSAMKRKEQVADQFYRRCCHVVVAISGVVQSRKRKLREVYAVARYVEYGETINPQFDITAEPLDQLEITFLNANDLYR
jgi:hypothetical protein